MFRFVKLLLPLVVLGGVALLVERLIVTDGEAVQGLVDDAAEAVREGDFQGLRGMLAESYRGEGRTPDGAVDRVKGLWKVFRPSGLSAQTLEVEVEGDRARAPVNVRGAVAGRAFVVSLDVEFVREEGGWKVAAALPRDWVDIPIRLPR
jgi:hypothetical protein